VKVPEERRPRRSTSNRAISLHPNFTLPFLVDEDINLPAIHIAGLKTVVNICRSYGTFFPAFFSTRRVETRR